MAMLNVAGCPLTDSESRKHNMDTRITTSPQQSSPYTHTHTHTRLALRTFQLSIDLWFTCVYCMIPMGICWQCTNNRHANEMLESGHISSIQICEHNKFRDQFCQPQNPQSITIADPTCATMISKSSSSSQLSALSSQVKRNRMYAASHSNILNAAFM